MTKIDSVNSLSTHSESLFSGFSAQRYDDFQPREMRIWEMMARCAIISYAVAPGETLYFSGILFRESLFQKDVLIPNSE